jgi:iron complex transport system ATP-binding protein
MLKVGGVGFSYHADRTILKEISFQLEKGDILCLLGPNGTGKTTLLRCVLGLNRPKSGQVLVNGENTVSMNMRQRAKLFAYVPQATGITFPYEAGEVVLMGRVAHLSPGGAPGKADRAISLEMMKKLGILELEHSLFQELSGGERQMVLVARALSQQANILIMDEPTASLDYGNQVKMLRVVKSLAEQGYAILMTSHFPDHAFLVCNKVVLMRDGYIMAQGAPEEIVTSETLSDLYQTPVRVTGTDIDVEGRAMKVCVPLMI